MILYICCSCVSSKTWSQGMLMSPVWDETATTLTKLSCQHFVSVMKVLKGKDVVSLFCHIF